MYDGQSNNNVNLHVLQPFNHCKLCIIRPWVILIKGSSDRGDGLTTCTSLYTNINAHTYASIKEVII